MGVGEGDKRGTAQVRLQAATNGSSSMVTCSTASKEGSSRGAGGRGVRHCAAHGHKHSSSMVAVCGAQHLYLPP